MNFRSLLVGNEAIEQVSIVNDEDVPFTIAFDEKCLTAHSSTGLIIVEPMTATIPPKQR